MLSKRRCPHTGVINFFTKSDPFVSVGSIVEAGRANREYHWRLYDAVQTISGIAIDLKTAEERVEREYRKPRDEDAVVG